MIPLEQHKGVWDIASIGTLTRLTELRLSGTDVSGDIKDIVGLKNLQVLFLSSTAVNTHTVRKAMIATMLLQIRAGGSFSGWTGPSHICTGAWA